MQINNKKTKCLFSSSFYSHSGKLFVKCEATPMTYEQYWNVPIPDAFDLKIHAENLKASSKLTKADPYLRITGK